MTKLTCNSNRIAHLCICYWCLCSCQTRSVFRSCDVQLTYCFF